MSTEQARSPEPRLTLLDSVEAWEASLPTGTANPLVGSPEERFAHIEFWVREIRVDVQELIEAAEAHLRVDRPHTGDPRLQAALAPFRGQK